MPLLPAVVPEIPENRAEVAAARLARKIAPLFGVPWTDGPFGGRTWVCDYAKITLSEIARGAPLPTREQATHINRPVEGAWTVVDRIGVTGIRATLPNEIANATLNRFGPDTRAAVVLIAVNRLLDPAREGIDAALALVVDQGSPLPEPLRLAAWASLVVEAFRSQPALVAAGVHARAIQRELVQPWQLPLAAGLDQLSLTRCEVAPESITRPPGSAPFTLDIADRTFVALHIDRGRSESDDFDLDVGPAELAGTLRRDESVDLLLRRLLAAGTSAEASYLWMSERQPNQLAVEALLPPSAVIDRFVRDAQRLLGASDDATDPPLVLPGVPSEEQLGRLTLLGRRAAFIALLAILRHIQNSPSARDATRAAIVPVLADVAARARAVLDEDDPVAVIVACRVADMTVQTLRPDRRQDLRKPLADLLTALTRCEELLGRGLLDRGAAAETISSACVELNAVAQTNARVPHADLPDADELRERVRHSWGVYHDALEIRPFSAAVDVPQPSGLAGYHLHNYAAFLAGSTDEVDLRDSVALFRDVVIPAREEFFAMSGHFLPLRIALQVASRATTRLGEATRARGDLAAAMEVAQLGRSWVTAALAGEETRRLLAADPPTESASRFALLAAPALLLAAELGGPSAVADRQQAEELIDLVRQWERDTVGGSAHHTRHEEVAALSDRAAAVRQS